MHRRHFIQWTGATLSSLVFSPWTGAATLPTAIITRPSAVLAGLDDGEHLLQPDGKGGYRYREVSVRLPASGNNTVVVVESPVQALRYIRLLWNLPSLKPASVLGDHWERTYGDLQFNPPSFDKKMPWYFIAQGEGASTMAAKGTSSGAAQGGSAGTAQGASYGVSTMAAQGATTCFGVKTGCNSIAYWQAGDHKLQLTLDTRSGGVGMQLIAGSGTPLFISAQPDAMGAEQKQVVRESFALAAQRLPAGEPLDWLTNPFPKEWLLNGEKRIFEWG